MGYMSSCPYSRNIRVAQEVAKLGFTGRPNGSKRKAVTRRAREGNSEVSDLEKKSDDRVHLD